MWFLTMIAAALAGISLYLYQLVHSKTLSVDQKLNKLEEMRASGKIKQEEYDKARQLILDSFCQ